jgi:hypothetical protein
MKPRASTSTAGGAVSRLPDIWPVIRRLPTGWTLTDLRDALPGPLKDDAKRSVDALLTRRWISITGRFSDGRISHRQFAVTTDRVTWPVSAAEALWNALRAMRDYRTSAEWAAIASTDELAISPQSARRYLAAWATAGHIRVSRMRPVSWAIMPASVTLVTPPAERPSGGLRKQASVNVTDLRRAA